MTLLAQQLIKRVTHVIILVSCAVFICACSSDNQDLLDTFDKVRARKGRPIEKIPEPKPVPKYIYPSYLKRRDPFFKYMKPSERLARKKKPDVNAPNLKRSKQALEEFKIKDLRMVGVLKRNKAVWGLIVTPDDVVMKVKVGDYIGLNYGQVKDISYKKISLVEKIKKNDEWHNRSVSMILDTVEKKNVSHQSIKVEEIVH